MDISQPGTPRLIELPCIYELTSALLKYSTAVSHGSKRSSSSNSGNIDNNTKLLHSLNREYINAAVTLNCPTFRIELLVGAQAISQPGTRLIELPRSCQLTYDESSDPRVLNLIQQVPEELWGAKLALQVL